MPEGQGKGHLQGVKTKHATERSSCSSRRKAEKKCEGRGVASCAGEADRASRLRKKPVLGRKDSKEKLLSLERRVVDQYELQQLTDLGLAGTSSGQQHSLSPWKSSAEGRRDESSPCSQLLQPHHLCAKRGQKRTVELNYPEKGSFSTPTRWSREEGPAPPRSSPSFSLALNKVGARATGLQTGVSQRPKPPPGSHLICNASGGSESRPPDLILWVFSHQKLLSCGGHSWLCYKFGVSSWEKSASLWFQELGRQELVLFSPLQTSQAGWRPSRL